MKYFFWSVLAVALLAPNAFADKVVPDDTASWIESYEQGKDACKAHDYKSAALLFEKARVTAENFKPGDSRLPAAISELMELDIKTKDSSKYEVHLAQQRAAYVKAFGPTYAAVGLLDGYKGRILERQKKYIEAEKLYLQAISVMEQGVGSDHPHIAEIAHRCAILQWEMGKPSDALKSIQKEETILRSMKPIDDKRLKANFSMQGYIYESLGMPTESQAAFGKALTEKATLANSSSKNDATSENSQ